MQFNIFVVTDEYNKCLEYLRICKGYYDHARQDLYLHIIDLKDQLVLEIYF